MTYLALKLLHLIRAAILFGTGLGIAFFAWFGYRQGMREGEIALVRGVLRLTVIADTVFTAVWAVVQPITGYFLWRITGGNWPDPGWRGCLPATPSSARAGCRWCCCKSACAMPLQRRPALRRSMHSSTGAFGRGSSSGGPPSWR